MDIWAGYEVGEYDGFEILKVWNNEDGSQYLRLDEDTVIWVSADRKESFLVCE